jgi:hypothetical protein
MRYALALAVLALAACGGTDAPTIDTEMLQTNAAPVPAAGSAGISADRGIYDEGQGIGMYFSGLPGNPDDMIVLARKGSKPWERIAEYTTMGVKAGNRSIPTAGKGEFVLRVFYDIYDPNDMTLWRDHFLNESGAFTVCDYL